MTGFEIFNMVLVIAVAIVLPIRLGAVGVIAAIMLAVLFGLTTFAPTSTRQMLSDFSFQGFLNGLTTLSPWVGVPIVAFCFLYVANTSLVEIHGRPNESQVTPGGVLVLLFAFVVVLGWL